jgi:hypothetical protein
MGEARVDDLAELTHVARVIAVIPDDDLFTAGQLEGELTLGGLTCCRL